MKLDAERPENPVTGEKQGNSSKKKHSSHTLMLPAFTLLKETGCWSRDSHENKKKSWCVEVGHPALPCASPASATVPPPHPQGRNQRFSKSRRVSCCTISISALALQTAGFPGPLCRRFALDETPRAQKRPPARQGRAGRRVRREGG